MIALTTVALLFAVGFLVWAGSSAAAPKRWYWSETYGEKRVKEKVRVPCHRVRPAVAGCDVEEARDKVVAWEERLAACDAITEIARQLACLASMTRERSPQANLQWVKEGFQISEVECVGGGQADKSGIRFTQLRCKVVVLDRDQANRVIRVSGRIVVYVTGQRTFRWAVIR